MKRGAFDYLTKPFEVGRRCASRCASCSSAASSSARSCGCATQVRGRTRLEAPDRAQRRDAATSSRRSSAWRGHARDGADHRRERHRQGAGRARDPRARARAATGPSSPSTAPRIPDDAARERAVRPRARRLHRRDRARAAAASRRPHGGTLFLDEIGEMPPPLQAKLLRVLQERRVERRRRRPSRSPVDVRVVAATHRDLERDVARGPLPRGPLLPAQRRSDRACRRCASAREDIRAARGALPRAARATRRAAAAVRVAPEALAALERYDWPGNVRELENAIERAVALCDDRSIAHRRSAPRAGARDAASRRCATRCAPARSTSRARLPIRERADARGARAARLEPDPHGRAAAHHPPRSSS